MSTIKVEYIALGYKVKKTVQIKRFINELKLEITGINLYGDNEMR